MNYRKFLLLLAFFTLFVSQVNAQENSVATWDLGINTGLYIPSNYHAEFYSGKPGNVNNINFILDNKHRYNEIKNLINASDTFFLRELPQKMTYTPSFMIGVFFRRIFENNLSFTLAFNFSKLTAADYFTLQIDPNTIFTEEDIRLYEIWGKERRSSIDLSLAKYFGAGNGIKTFVEFGLNFNFTEVIEHKIGIETQEYSLVNRYLNQQYVPGAQINEYDIQQGGTGYGLMVGGGFSLSNNSSINIEPGFSVYIQKINLEEYNAIRPSFLLYVRFSLGNYFADEA